MNTRSFMAANFVARELNYDMPEGWMQGDDAANAWFSPIATFEERFDEMLKEVAGLGFEAIDIWSAHLNFKWATPGHIRTARRLLQKHNLRAVSYAASVGDTKADLEAACLLCRELDIPVIGGGMALLQTDRNAAVKILRSHGIQFGLENHPEKSAEEVLGKLGQGDEDVIGVALDTGWFATQGADPVTALKQLGPRLKHVHMKDVKAPRNEKTGYALIDMGHETCPLGEGIAGVEACARALVEVGYTGPVSIEHEPEDSNPSDDCRESLRRLTKWLDEGTRSLIPDDPVGIAIVGCGNISSAYASELVGYPHIQLLGAHDLEHQRAEELTSKYGGKVYDTLDDVLQDERVEIVVNLTIHNAHVEIITKCLQAGKHVHSEKPLAGTHTEAEALVRLAADRGLRLSCAPSTWMGEAQQTAWKMVREGKLGTPRVAYAEVNWGRIESWHPNPGPFYAAGPVFDVAVYPLTLLTAWFGPAKRVIAGGGVLSPSRETKDGIPFTIDQVDWSAAVVQLSNGIMARITASFYTGWNSRQHGLEIHGDDGMLALDRWDVYDSSLYYSPTDAGEGHDKVPLLRPAYHGIGFARGLSDLAIALREGRPHRTTGKQAAHVVEIVDAIHASMKDGNVVKIESTFEPPEPSSWAQ